MRKTLRSMVLVSFLAGVCSLNAAGSALDGSAPLSDALKVFNERAVQDPIGREQPPLTEEEVVAAIRWWDLDRSKAPVSDEEYRAFRQIAETRRLPAGWDFEVLTGFEPNHAVAFEAWSVRIRMPKQNGGTYAFSIRERAVRSRLIGPEERQVIEKWERKEMGSLQRMEYRRERAAAAERDQSKQK